MHLDQFGVVEVEIDIEVVVDHEVGADGVEHYCLGEVFKTEVGDGLFGRLLVHGGGRVRGVQKVRGVRKASVVLCKDREDLQKDQKNEEVFAKKTDLERKRRKKRKMDMVCSVFLLCKI